MGWMSPVPVQIQWQRRAQSRCRCHNVSGVEPGTGADVAGVSPVPVHMWEGRAQSRCRCRKGWTRSRCRCGRVSPFPVQMLRQGRAPLSQAVAAQQRQCALRAQAGTLSKAAVNSVLADVETQKAFVRYSIVLLVRAVHWEYTAAPTQCLWMKAHCKHLLHTQPLHPFRRSTRTGPTPATSAQGPGSPLPHPL